MLEDPPVHLYKWLRPDLVPPALFFTCDPEVPVDGSSFFLTLMPLRSSFTRLGCHSFAAGIGAVLILISFRAVADELTPLLDEIKLLPLSGDLLYDAVQKKRPTVGSLDGWGGESSRLFQLHGLIGWQQPSPGLRRMGFAFIAVIPLMETLGHRPLCAPPIAHQLWASLRLHATSSQLV